ncbi:MAG: bifunctional phosphoribosylaminoimidazolecarboxamide formyltransferase/IMP cyclohydrolase [Armatimonadota bacterium]|nr:bifunctional phosphoribosylaminoimidazolecarboxamide formyltransferase/IMP cyclohydrolase [Armatimonadota bacterium]
MKVRRALVSVSDKTGVVEFVKELQKKGVEIISTGGTAKALSEAGVNVIGISDVTGFPEMLEGRVKTLHPAVHGGILADRTKPDHMKTIEEHGIKPIDMVVVNLYPFAKTVAKPDVTLEDAVENIDIGGPSMVRSAAKNFAAVAIVVDPADYPIVLDEIGNTGGVSEATRARLSAKAYAHTSAYDWMITNYLSAKFAPEDAAFPKEIDLRFEKVQDLRYGENPHQKAAFYREPGTAEPSVATAKQLSGKELSFNNIYDLNAAFELVKEFDGPAIAIIKHTNPCGCCMAPTLAEAFVKAREADMVSAFGGIVASNRPIDVATAEAITAPNSFYEAIIAPGFAPEAIPILTELRKWGANLRLLEVASMLGAVPNTIAAKDIKKVTGGILVQDRDIHDLKPEDLKVATKAAPTPEQIEQLLFAWKVVKHVKSNAIVIAANNQLLGAGAGQMNRVNSVRLAVAQAGEKAKGAVLASDAFFPFADGPEEAAKAGVVAIIQPGGSVRDEEVIELANKYGIAMVFTGARHFLH